MIKLEIDGQTVDAEKDELIITVTDKLGIYIPRFCYDKNLSNISACRACLVEVDGHKKLEPACSTKVCHGMQVHTNSVTAIAARKSVLELLLINHPLDCPVCDKAGACDLQDIVMECGKDASRHREVKRSLVSKDFGPLVQTEMNRCIQCMKCTRFCDEIAGSHDLAVINRGENTTIGSISGFGMTVGVAGNVIDLCPVGALLAKPGLFTARNWELKPNFAVAPHDCIGSNLTIYSSNKKIAKVVAKENPAINGAWIADRERFSYQAITSKDRLEKPLFKHQGKWIETNWNDALLLTNKQLQAIISRSCPQAIGGLITPSATIEEQYLLQKYLRGLGSNNIDHRLQQLDFRCEQYAPAYPNLGVELADIEQQKIILLVGSDPLAEQPIFALKLRQMVARSGKIAVVNPHECKFNFALSAHNNVNGIDLITPLLSIIKVLLKKTKQLQFAEFTAITENIAPKPIDKKIAELLQDLGSDKSIVLGNLALSHPQATTIIYLSQVIGKLCNANFATLTMGANAAGAWLAGCVPHRGPGNVATPAPGKNAYQMLTKPLQAYLLFGIEPDLDSILGQAAINTLQQADFTVAVTSFTSKALFEVADVMLPLATFAETSGTFVNVTGTWQSFNAAIEPLYQSRPGWKILNQLIQLANIADCDHTSTIEIITLLENMQVERKIHPSKWNIIGLAQEINDFAANASKDQSRQWLTANVNNTMGQIDPLLRRSVALQQALKLNYAQTSTTTRQVTT